jgi:hypothetical protein
MDIEDLVPAIVVSEGKQVLQYASLLLVWK